MKEIAKREFLRKFGTRFSGNDMDGYNFESVYVAASEVREITNGVIDDFEELKTLCKIKPYTHENDDWSETHNSILANIFGDEENYQGSYEEVAGSGDYNWYLNFGKFKIDQAGEGFIYIDVHFHYNS
jgi:hypothetical protein